MAHIYNRTSEKQRRRSLRSEMPKAEEILWSKLRGRQMLGLKLRRQYSVGTYIVDFHCAGSRIAIEIDGDSHFQKGSSGRDDARQVAIESFGIRFLRFRNVEFFEHLDVVLAAIERRLLELGMKR
jgi:very-short-patch-repair endonuclease